jgi:hypothetical protein
MDPNQQPQNQPQPDAAPPPQTPQQQMQAAGQNQWQYTSGQLTAEQPPQPQQQATQDPEILAEWSAQEFVEHDKDTKWYLMLAAATVVLSAVLFLILREIMPVVVTVLLAIVVGIYGSAKPKTVSYKVDGSGISLDGKHFEFNSFKSFSIIESSAIPYIQLMPQKRFMVPLSIFVDPAHSQDIAELIGQFVPYDQKNPDVVDKLATKFRF